MRKILERPQYTKKEIQSWYERVLVIHATTNIKSKHFRLPKIGSNGREKILQRGAKTMTVIYKRELQPIDLMQK